MVGQVEAALGSAATRSMVDEVVAAARDAGLQTLKGNNKRQGDVGRVSNSSCSTGMLVDNEMLR